MSYFLALMAAASVFYPHLAALAGLGFQSGRVVYSLGYYSGVPSKRIPGAIMAGVLGQLPLMAMTIYGAAKTFDWL